MPSEEGVRDINQRKGQNAQYIPSNREGLFYSYFLPIEAFPLDRRLLGNSQVPEAPETKARLRSDLLSMSYIHVSQDNPYNKTGAKG